MLHPAAGIESLGVERLLERELEPVAVESFGVALRG